MARLKNFVKVLNEQVFALMQKTDCLNRKAVSLTFSVSFLAKFCEFQNLRSDDLRHIQRISSQKFIYHINTNFSKCCVYSQIKIRLRIYPYEQNPP